MSDICLISTIFGKTNISTRLKNLELFYKHINDCGMLDHLYVGNCTNHHIPGKVFNFYNDQYLWQKEAIFNRMLLLPEIQKYKKIILVDPDIYYTNNNWIKETSYLLDKYYLCQPFTKINYKTIDNISIDSTIDGTVAQYIDENNTTIGNGGLIIGYSKEYLDHMNGLYDKCLVGGGDTFNLLPFFLNTKMDMSLLDRLFIDLKNDYMAYFLQAQKFLKDHISHKKSCYYLNHNAQHMFHGQLSHRNYDNRYQLINQYRYDTNIIKDYNGMFCLNTESTDYQVLHTQLTNYFNQREYNYLYPYYIWSSTKYRIEFRQKTQEPYLWMSEYNILRFANIKKVKLYCHTSHPLHFAYFVHDNQINNIDFQDNSSIVIIDNPNKIQIHADYVVPFQHSKNTDTRKLSFYISKIEVLLNNSTEFIDYPLQNIL
jgi:hypothetical protein